MHFPLASVHRFSIFFALVAALLSTVSVILVENPFLDREQRISMASRYSSGDDYSYRGHDYPQEWKIPPVADVQLHMENTWHYTLDSELGMTEWSRLMPKGDGILHLGPDHRPFSVSMFHQLSCINVVREGVMQLYGGPPVNQSMPLLRHCMNYLRQMVLCRSNTQLQSVRRPFGGRLTTWDQCHTCKDWNAVYSAAESNYREYVQWTESGVNA
ncbi:hypothetical protein F5146DRAFT_1067424 [Armillaria mellea]|nr:hypothetical protein F5146DRAFT_1067402 [Armillaria mellea]KAK0186805.1 hypothetical protein F5146DRAFT_1067424 [Armillaria mellea]